eukprot:m.154781 g.154781  ORF g.154781 m.154781 type:complete len:347 (+) comp13322_c0_seq11:2187-3227(+)
MTTSRTVDHLPPKLDVTQASVAYGARAIPKLQRELGGNDVLVIQQGLRSLCDLLRNPSYISEAIEEGILDECKRLCSHENNTIRMLSLQLLVHVSSHAVGRTALLTLKYIQPLTDRFVDDEAVVREFSHKVMGNMAMQMQCGAAIIEAGLSPILIERIVAEDDPRIKIEAMTTVRYCLKCNADPFLETNAMKVIVDLLSHDNADVRSNAAMVLTEISFPLKGKQQAVKFGAVAKVVELLKDNCDDVRTGAAASITTICITTEAKEEAERQGVIDALPSLLNADARRVVLAGIKAITVIASLPNARKSFGVLIPKLKSLQVKQPNALDEDVMIRAAQHAIDAIQWTP